MLKTAKSSVYLKTKNPLFRVSVLVSVGFSESCANVRCECADHVQCKAHGSRMDTADLRCAAFLFGVLRDATETAF
jgi:hypothetical protein